PEEFFQDEAELRGGAEGVEQAEVGALRGEVELADGGPAIGEFELIEDVRGERIGDRRDAFEDAVEQAAKDSGGDLAGGFVDGDDAAGVDGGVAIVIARENLELGMHDGEAVAIGIEFDFSEERDFSARCEDIGEVAAVEPFAGEDAFGGIGEGGFEEAEVAAAEPGDLGAADFGEDGGHFAGREIADRFDVAAVFVAEGGVGEEVFDGFETLGFEHGGSGGADAFEVHEWSGEVQRGLRFRITSRASGSCGEGHTETVASDGESARAPSRLAFGDETFYFERALLLSNSGASFRHEGDCVRSAHPGTSI